MKNELLLSALLLSSSVQTMAAQDFNQIRSMSRQNLADLIDQEFETSTTINKEVYDYDENGDGSRIKIEASIVFQFIKVDPELEYYDFTKTMNYEVHIMYRDIETGKLYGINNDSDFYVKKMKNQNTYRFYDCGSTSHCVEDDYHIDFSVYNNGNNQVIKIRENNIPEVIGDQYILRQLPKNTVLYKN